MPIYEVPTPEAEAGLDQYGAQLPTPANPLTPAAPVAPVAPQMPAVPAGYNSWPELALAHQNLRAMVASQPPAPAPVVPAVTPAPAVGPDGKALPVPAPAPVPVVPPPAGVQHLDQQGMQQLWYEWQANGGSLSPETYQRLQTQNGITPDMVNQFVQGQQAQAQVELGTMYSAVGGKENFEAMAAWALRELPPAEAEGYNRLIANANQSGDVAVITTAVQALASKWQASEGFQQGRALRHPTLAAPGPGGLQGPSMAGMPYASTAEWQEAQGKPEYKSSAAYRAEFMQRTAASQAAGVI